MFYKMLMWSILIVSHNFLGSLLISLFHLPITILAFRKNSCKIVCSVIMFWSMNPMGVYFLFLGAPRDTCSQLDSLIQVIQNCKFLDSNKQTLL